MSESCTLEFENARSLQTLFCHDLRLLKEMEQALGLKITTRDGWIRFEGAPEGIERGRRAFDQLQQASRQGIAIGPREFACAIRGSGTPETDSLPDLVDARILPTRGRDPIVPKSAGQRDYIDAIRRHDIVFGIGPAGTGKTYLAVAMAVADLHADRVHRIILTRPAVEAGEALGFLPGTMEDKVFPYLRPLYDALHDMLDAEEIQRHLERGIVEIAPLAYMRGRTLNQAFVILDEAQNTTREQMFMFLTRLGERSKAVVTGDDTQVDLPPHKRSGLFEARDALADVPGIAFCRFDKHDVVRHALVQRIIGAYQQHRGAPAPPSPSPD